MRYYEKQTDNWGRVLWITDEKTEIAVALDFGIRIVYAACVGCENLFYEQPSDRSDGFTTNDGWILYGGHRLWLAPESDNSYYPDNEPVRYSVQDQTILFEQNIDPILKIRKRLSVCYGEDGRIQITQSIENVSDQPITGAAWGVNTLDAGGEVDIHFACQTVGGYNPQRVVSLWSDTNIGDPRLQFTRDHLHAQYLPLDDYLKLGLYSSPGKAVFRNKDQEFVLTFDAQPYIVYPDNGCNFELYMCKRFTELESLGKMTTILPGQCADHTETWRIVKRF